MSLHKLVIFVRTT